MGGACSSNGGEDECKCVIGGKFRRKETTTNTKTWVDNIRIRVNLGDIGLGGLD
jgi:hypothetical protein